MSKFILNNQQISVADIQRILQDRLTVELSTDCIEKIQKCRAYLDEKVAQSDELIYGVNTGFGSLCNTAISKDDLAQLQLNLVRSHACGTGDTVQPDVVRIMLLLKAIGLSFGHSGAQVATVERLLFYFNHAICPVVYEQGSLGASGDLAPLAHIALSLIGEGEVNFGGEILSTEEFLKKHNLQPIVLASKEGLALLNGTQFMSAFLTKAVMDGNAIVSYANKIAALSVEAYDGRIEPFTPHVNAIRNQEGQIAVAKEISSFLEGSHLIAQHKQHVQDPYCLRCIPQVHGASLDTLNYARTIVEREINAVTDNPTVFPDEDLVISAGNFHGQPLALALDFMAIAMAELGSISERRVFKLMGGERGLPAFLVAKPGLNSGFMIAQYTAASIVSQNKQLCTPASVDSVDSSNGQEDHVSMGANAATKLARVIENVYQILGIEYMAACQALEIRGASKTSAVLQDFYQEFRNEIPFIEEDVYMSVLLRKSKALLKN
jgi:histidine ammonia-lyase